MYIFQFIADMLHFLSFLIIIKQIKKTRTVSELSYRTQEIYLIVFLSRYMDIFLYFISLYNLTFKIMFISATCYIIYLIRFAKPYCLAYDKNTDSLNHYLYIYPSALILTILFHMNSNYYKTFEYFWSFSIWLEAFAIIPQLYIIYKKKEVEIVTGTYMACLGLYRFFYIINWIYQYTIGIHLTGIKIFAAIIQTIIYGDFLYYYLKSVKSQSTNIILPV